MTVDRERIAQYIEAIDRLLRDWEDHSAIIKLETLKRDRKTCLFLCYVMEGAIQTSLDLANHLIANFGWPKPANYKDSFKILGDERWIPVHLTPKLEELAGFRNILVHRYPDLDLKRVLPHVRNSWKTIREFVRAVASKAKKK